MSATTFKFDPGEWVVITFAGVNYKGRVSECKLRANNTHSYEVEFVNDSGDFKSGYFSEDEIERLY